MSQRHYSPDQGAVGGQSSSLGKNKRLREGGSTSKFLESGSRFCEEEVIVGDYRYKKSNQIGAGYSSRVYRGTGKDKAECAVKVIDMRKFSSSGLQMLENQIEILKKLSHPNIIKLFYVSRTQSHTYLVTELCKGGDLMGHMTKRGRLGEEVAAAVMSDVVEGVKYLMQMGIIHRDIKPANILCSEKVWKLADFGFSICHREEIRTRQNVGTPLYMPIESLLKNIYSSQSDIFAVGVMYYELLVGVTPWECRSEKELIKRLATVPFSVPEKYRLSSSIKFLLNKMCSVDKATRLQKEEFAEINIRNFGCLNNFNDPPLAPSKRTEEAKRSVANQSPANKIRRSKSKSRPMSKEKAREYKLGRRRKSAEKSEGKGKKSVEKEVTAKGGYTIKDESTTYPSLMPEGQVSVDRFEIINQKILTSQLDYCRFLYYLIQNHRFIPLSEQSSESIVMVLFKHLIKLIKQLADVRQNAFKLPHWDSFKQSQRCKKAFSIFGEYLDKYEKEYLRHLKEANIVVIKEVNQKFSELGSSEPLSLSFYRKVQALMGPALKECLLSSSLQGDGSKGYMEGVRCLAQYYRWVDTNVKNFQNYVLQRNIGVVVTKNFKNSEITIEAFAQVQDQIRTF